MSLASSDHLSLIRSAQAQQALWQQELDRLWSLLCSNDPDVVLATLAEAFSDNEAAATAVSVTGSEVTLLLLAPSLYTVPERKGSVTATGNPSLARMSKTGRNSLYLSLVCGHLLVTLKEAFAVAPGLSVARVVMVRESVTDAYGRTRLDCIMAGTWSRAAFQGVRWTSTDAAQIAYDTASELLVNAKSSNELAPIVTDEEPEIQAVLSALASTDQEDEAATLGESEWQR